MLVRDPWRRFAFFFRGSFGLADSDQEFCLRSGQLASTGGTATPADLGEVFADLARQGYSFTVHDSYRKPFTIHSASIQKMNEASPPVSKCQADPSDRHAFTASACG